MSFEEVGLAGSQLQKEDINRLRAVEGDGAFCEADTSEMLISASARRVGGEGPPLSSSLEKGFQQQHLQGLICAS